MGQQLAVIAVRSGLEEVMFFRKDGDIGSGL